MKYAIRGGGRNKVLDDFETFRAGFSAGDYLQNVDARKMSGHRDRFSLLAGLIDLPLLKSDYSTAKLIHHSLMFVSGGFRVQSYLQAGGQSGYEQRRFGHLAEPNGAAGVPIDLAVTEGLSRSAAIISATGVDTAALRDLSLAMNETVYGEHNKIYDWFSASPKRKLDKIELNEAPVQAALRCQQTGICLATIHIAAAAKLRGDDLGLVPFLEPKSISDASPEPIYPLAA